MSYKSQPTRLVRKYDEFLASLVGQVLEQVFPYDQRTLDLIEKDLEEKSKLTGARLMDIRTGAMSKLETQ